MRVRLRIVATFAILVLTAFPAFSQSQTASADIKGSVIDTTGGVLPRATVTLTNIETVVERSVSTDDMGGFRLFLVPPADYELKIQLPSFSTYTRRPLHVGVGETVTIEVVLQPSTILQEVLVQGETQGVEAEKTQQSNTITEDEIENLPINERNFLNFTLLTPGVTDSKGIITFSLPQANASGLSFLGQSGRSNNVTIDGVDNNDDAVAGVRSTLSQEAVQEFQINRSGFSAEFGRAGGGLVNIVSKSGTNRFRGDLFGFFRDNSMDSRNPFAFGPNGTRISPPYSRQQAGFIAGGPLKKDTSFFLLSYEGLRQRESNFVTFMENATFFQPTPSQLALIQGLLAGPSPSLRASGATLNNYLTTSQQLFPGTISALAANSGVFPYKNNNNTASLRLDHSISPANQMSARLTFTDIDTIGGNTGGLIAPSRGANFAIQDYSGAFADTHFFTPRAANEFRFQFASRKYNVLPADAFGPEVTINGVAEMGRDFFLPSKRTEKRWQWLDNMTFVAGKHEIKFGGDFNYIPFDTSTAVFLGGRFIFGQGIPLGSVIDTLLGPGNSTALASGLAASGRSDLIPNLSNSISALQAFNFGLPIVYQQGFGNPHAAVTNTEVTGYIQDNFKAAAKVTLNLGLRYDMEFQAHPLHRDRNNFGPRFGFSYSPDSRTAFRGGYGIY